MKKFAVIGLLLLPSESYAASEVISCGDVTAVGGEARMALHKLAQERASKEIEEFIERRLVTPYVDAFGSAGDEESTASLIEVFWCETNNTPLHDAYYRLYSRNKHLFEGVELPPGFKR